MRIDHLRHPRTIGFLQMLTPLTGPRVQLIQRQPPRPALIGMPAANRLFETERRRRSGQVNAEDVDVLSGVLRRGGVVAAADFDHARFRPWVRRYNLFRSLRRGVDGGNLWR